MAQNTWDYIWSIDDGSTAVSTTARHLLFGPETGVKPVGWMAIWMSPTLVAAMLVVYLGGIVVLQKLCKMLNTTGKSLAFKAFVLLHNLGLCVFSGGIAYRNWTITGRIIKQIGLVPTYCSNSLWENGMASVGFLFYLSKYYELVDTALLIVKRKVPSFLQVWHHAVTFVCAYMLQASHSSTTFIFVGLNAVVHTIMYFYYALSTVGIRLPGKSAITSMQIFQFFLGIAIVSPIYFIQGCATTAHKISVGAMIGHALYLAFLFAAFYKRSYLKKKKAE